MNASRRLLIKAWIDSVTSDRWLDTMAGVGELHVRKTLEDGTRMELRAVAPNLEPPAKKVRKTR